MAEAPLPQTTVPETVQAPLVKPPIRHSKTHYLIYFLAGLLEILLLFRLVFKLTAADPQSSFVGFIYNFTNIFVAPYSVFVFEPGTLVAMGVYAVLAWGIAKIIQIAVGRKQN